MFYKKVKFLKIKKLRMQMSLGDGPWKSMRLLSNIFLINTSTKQALIISFKKVNGYSYENLSKHLNCNYTEVSYNDILFYHYWKNFKKQELFQFEWILIKNSFVVSLTTTVSSKKSEREVDDDYEVINNIIKSITDL